MLLCIEINFLELDPVVSRRTIQRDDFAIKLVPISNLRLDAGKIHRLKDKSGPVSCDKVNVNI